MERQQKRKLSAWVLLSVFLPILLFSSLHVHENVSGQGDCYECVNHLPHGGHISLQTASIHDCVLCQYVSLSFISAVALALALTGSANAMLFFFPSSWCLSTARRPHSPRAPPVI